MPGEAGPWHTWYSSTAHIPVTKDAKGAALPASEPPPKLRGISRPRLAHGHRRPCRAGSAGITQRCAGGSCAAAEGQVSVRVCTGARCSCLQRSLCATTCRLPAPARRRGSGRAWGVMERRECRSAADRGATLPRGRGREAARSRLRLRGRPSTGAGGGPAGVRTAFPFPLPAFLPRCAGSFVLPAAARRNRRAERPRHSALPSRGRAPGSAPSPYATLPPLRRGSPLRVGPPPPPRGPSPF